MIVNLSEAQKQLGFKTPYTLRKAVTDGRLDDYLRVGPDRRCTYLELTPPGMPTLRERIQGHTAFHGNSPLWNKDDPGPSGHWSERANEYLDPSRWPSPPWTRDQWITLRNVIEMAEDQ